MTILFLTNIHYFNMSSKNKATKNLPSLMVLLSLVLLVENKNAYLQSQSIWAIGQDP
jgi:hypothetical protein